VILADGVYSVEDLTEYGIKTAHARVLLRAIFQWRLHGAPFTSTRAGSRPSTVARQSLDRLDADYTSALLNDHPALLRVLNAADAECQLAQSYAAMLYHQGTSFLQPNSFKASLNATKALRWLLQEVQAGSHHAQNNYGYLLLHGIAVEKSDELALQHFKLAAEQGSVYAQMNLARFYDHGIIEEKEPEEAFKLYRLAADSGNAVAQYQLGERHKKGLGIKKNPKAAYKRYQTAAAQGCGDAMAAMGCCLLDGVGVAKDEVAAVAQLRRAVEQGSAMGMYWLGQCHERGLLVADLSGAWGSRRLERALAAELYLRAALLNYAPAQILLAGISGDLSALLYDSQLFAYKCIRNADEQCPNARAVIEDAITQAGGEVVYGLGTTYQAIGRKGDARKFFKRALELGVNSAQDALNKCL
jgi:TPR repeat protein